MKLDFVIAQRHDLEKIVSTYNATVASRLVTADLVEVTVESKVAWFEQHISDSRPLWIIYKENVYAGWMSFTSFYGRPAYDATVEVSIYLEQDYRGIGIGKICLQKAFDVSAHLKIKTLLGFIFEHNEQSLNLFYKMGFQKWAHLPMIAKMDDTERGLIILGKRIHE